MRGRAVLSAGQSNQSLCCTEYALYLRHTCVYITTASAFQVGPKFTGLITLATVNVISFAQMPLWLTTAIDYHSIYTEPS